MPKKANVKTLNTNAKVGSAKASPKAQSKPKSRKTNDRPSFTMEEVDGRTLRVAHWKATGRIKKTPLLFFNGIGANIEAMSPMADMLKNRDFITFDMPGVGDSPDPLIPYNAVLMARIASILLERFNMDVVDVMGVSWGGAMAQQFALQYPKHVRKVILAATTAGMVMVPGNPKAILKMADPRRYIDPSFMRRHFSTLYGGSSEGSEDHIGRLKPPTKTGYFYQLMAMFGWTSAPFLPFMSKNTLIMVGGEDQIVRPVNGDILKALIPNSEIFRIEEGGHLFLLSHVEESLAAIRGFLDRDAEEYKEAA